MRIDTTRCGMFYVSVLTERSSLYLVVCHASIVVVLLPCSVSYLYVSQQTTTVTTLTTTKSTTSTPLPLVMCLSVQ
jgi:hypothetical protein